MPPRKCRKTGLKVGDQLTYTISYKNTEDTASTVTITDKGSHGNRILSADNGGALDEESGIVTWTLNGGATRRHR